MMTKQWMAVAGVIGLAACGAEPLLVLDEAEVSARIATVEALVPQCHSTGAAAMARTSAQQVSQMLGLLDVLGLMTPQGELVPRTIAGVGASGSCGGTLTVSSEHGSGNTAYTVDLASFCVSSAEGDITYDGRLKATQIGNSSPDGPIVSALDAQTEGPLAVTNGATSLSVEVSGLHVDYGNPLPWNPGYPDAANPDQIRLGEARMDWNNGERVDFVRNVKAERPTGSPATLHITEGQVGTVGEGMVTINTPADDPLVANVGSLPAISGSVELHGADDTVVVVTPSAGTLTFEVGGMPMSEQLDCGDLMAPTVELGLALIGAFPVR